MEPPDPASVVEAVPDALPDPLVVLDEAVAVRWANPAAERFFGWALDDHVGGPALELLHPDDHELALASLATVGAKVVGTAIEVRVRTATGWRLVEVVGATARVGDEDLLLLALRDLTERRRWEVASGDDALFRSVVHNAAALVIVLDPAGRIRSANGAVTRDLGHDPEVLAGRSLLDLVDPSDHTRVRESLQGLWADPPAARRVRLDVGLAHRDGRELRYSLQLTRLDDDAVAGGGVVVSGHDVTELETARAALAHSASHDQLTGLLNRGELLSRLDERLTTRPPGGVAVGFVDLDRFKPINDLHGHDAGDEVLVRVAHRLRNAVRDGDLVARFGGDEFVVVLDVDDRHPRLDELTRRLEGVVGHPVDLDSGPVDVSASAGVVVSRRRDTAESLVTDADAAMYRRKHRAHSPLGGHATGRHQDQRAIRQDLPDAFRRDEIEVHYQSVVDLATGGPVGLEALVRWHHPVRGVLGPAEFLDVVHDLRREGDLGRIVATRAVADLRRLHDDTGADPTLSINVSVHQLVDPGLPRMLDDALRSHGVPPDRLEVEVSERVVATVSADGLLAAVRSLHGAGVRVAVDDVGTGSSSLADLARLGVDTLKLDRSVVAGLGVDPTCDAVADAVLAFGSSLGTRVVAEGIEHGHQVAALTARGCRYGQGYHFDEPAPIDVRTAERALHDAVAAAGHDDGTAAS